MKGGKLWPARIEFDNKANVDRKVWLVASTPEKASVIAGHQLLSCASAAASDELACLSSGSSVLCICGGCVRA